MTIRKEVFANDEYYHIFSRSIAGFQIFNNDQDFTRFLETLELYRYQNFTQRYSEFIDLDINTQAQIRQTLINENDVFANVICFCVMPTHFHLALQQKNDGGIVKYVGKVLNSYTKYFNEKHKRSGPLWSSRFKSVHIRTDEQLLHLTRYIHLNPTSANLAKKPEEWQYSSFSQYIDKETGYPRCLFDQVLDIEPKQYKKFVYDRKSYQRNLSIIKSLTIDDYTG